jgi:dTDP-4-dehydrorhamnose reductase
MTGKIKVVVLGASGMLGSMVLDELSRDPELALIATTRRRDLQGLKAPDNIEWRFLDAEGSTVKKIAAVLGGADWAINAIGVIKPYIHDDNAAEVERAISINTLFPHALVRAAGECGCRVLQIATDCVYSGRQGHYTEKDEHDPLDVYGKTKSLGEVFSPNMYHLRCSIIGPEPKGHVSLLDWFLTQPRQSHINGYVNHRWNGVTTLHFARLCRGIIKKGLKLPHVQHVVPSGSLTKAELLGSFAREYRRGDITITPAEASMVVDRTLATLNEKLNRKLWQAAGYASPPSVPEMVAELAHFNYRFSQEMTK